jgi:hypothetical protein
LGYIRHKIHIFCLSKSIHDCHEAEKNSRDTLFYTQTKDKCFLCFESLDRRNHQGRDSWHRVEIHRIQIVSRDRNIGRGYLLKIQNHFKNKKEFYPIILISKHILKKKKVNAINSFFMGKGFGNFLINLFS